MAQEVILIIEDDVAMLRGLKDNFEFGGYSVATAQHGEEGLEEAMRLKPDLIILDLMLPGMNGYEICRALRQEEFDMPIIMLTAKSQESDIVLGLNLGANDYITKPFSIKELMARAKAALRSKHKTEPQIYQFGEYELNMRSRKLSRKGRDIPLTPKEIGLLAFLVKEPGRAFTRDQILNAVWGHHVMVTQRSVDRCVNSLRNKIEPEPGQSAFIQTVRDIGYRFENIEPLSPHPTSPNPG